MSLLDSLETAYQSRQPLIDTLHTSETDCYRLFHGSVEGAPGLTIDRYGDLLLVQSFHAPVEEAQLNAISRFYAERLASFELIYNDRSAANSRIANALSPEEQAKAERQRIVHESGVQYLIQARHAGQDPWLFLDLRAARRYVMSIAEGKSVLNLFAYTCGVGIAASKAGARYVVNVDFAESSLAVGKANAKLNDLPHRPRFVLSDFFPAVRQLAGIGQADRVRGKRMPPFPALSPQQFDIVFMDPPRYAKSAFGVVDLVNDYPALLKPALLTTAPGGTLVCSNNVAQVDRDAWLEQIERSARKAGRPVQAVEWITPDADFPSFDGAPPLKSVALTV